MTKLLKEYYIVGGMPEAVKTWIETHDLNELEDAHQWLSDAGLITIVHLVEKPESPVSGFADKTYFKVYMSEVGLFRDKSGVAAKSADNTQAKSYKQFCTVLFSM